MTASSHRIYICVWASIACPGPTRSDTRDTLIRITAGPRTQRGGYLLLEASHITHPIPTNQLQTSLPSHPDELITDFPTLSCQRETQPFVTVTPVQVCPSKPTSNFKVHRRYNTLRPHVQSKVKSKVFKRSGTRGVAAVAGERRSRRGSQKNMHTHNPHTPLRIRNPHPHPHLTIVPDPTYVRIISMQRIHKRVFCLCQVPTLPTTYRIGLSEVR